MTNIFVTEFSKFSENILENSIKLPIRFYSDVHLQLKQFSMVLPNGLETVRQFFTGIRLEHNTHLQHLFLFQVARKLHKVDGSKVAELINFLTYSILTFRKRQNWRRIRLCS